MTIIDDFFGYLGILLLIINAILYTKSYWSNMPSMALKYFTSYLVFICLIQIIVLVYAYYIMDNLYLSHFYFIGQFILLSLFYKEGFNANQKKGVNVILILVLLTLCIQYVTNIKLFYKFNILEVFITSFPIIVYSIIHLYNSLSKKKNYMYINAGILMYLTTSTLIFILGDYITTYIRSVPSIRNDAIVNIWLLNKVLYVGYLLLILFEWKKNILPAKRK